MFTESEVIDGCLFSRNPANPEPLNLQPDWGYNIYYPFTNFLGHPNVGGFNLYQKHEPYSKVGPNSRYK